MSPANIKALHDVIGDTDVDLIGSARLDKNLSLSELEKISRLLPGANSVIVMAMEIPQEVFRHLSFKQEVGAMGLRELYHQTEQLIVGRLDWEAYKLVKKLHAAGYAALALPAGGPYDPRFLKGAISYKHAAQAAGLGNIGWHSLLMTPEYGPRIKLAAVLTNARLETRRHRNLKKCSRCGTCIKACPAGAIKQPAPKQPYQIDVHACNSFLTSVGLCAECMKVCPSSKTKGDSNG